MARHVFGMNQSLDGYVDHTELAPDPALFWHFTPGLACAAHVGRLAIPAPGRPGRRAARG